MNKTLIGMAIAAILAAPVANAGMKISGTIQAEGGSFEEGTSASSIETGEMSGAKGDSGVIDDQGGQNSINISVSEDLGNGLKAIGKIGMSFSTFDGDGLGQRDAYAGIAGSNWHAAFGRASGAYKGASAKWDPFIATSLQARGNGGMSGGAFGHGSYVKDGIDFAVKSGAFKLHGQYSADETNDNGAGHDGSNLWAVTYDAGDLDLMAAIANNEKDGDRNFKVGAKYAAGGMTLAAQYEDVETGGYDGDTGNYLFLTGSMDIGSGNTISGWFGNFDADASGNDASSFALGINHKFSKKTKLYAGFRSTDSDVDASDEAATVVGLVVKF